MEKFFWIGGARWVDLVNTEAIRDGARVELLQTPSDATVWLLVAGLVGNDFEANAGLLEALKSLRAQLRALCEAAHANAEPSQSALDGVNLLLRDRALRWELNGEWEAREVPVGREESVALFTLAREAAQTLGSQARAQVKPCGNPACILWFLDTSKNRTRRWCAMEGCGNRMKVAAHYARKKAS